MGVGGNESKDGVVRSQAGESRKVAVLREGFATWLRAISAKSESTYQCV